ncbi:hypothetical protein RMSM_05295 [Rhodopirellula maiorica SM1]|uniref:Uncharacterized protein n=1 Tax=Rhodopirellula maiorica SM1 TaxID=1265738 RepID=M5RUZ6_9BACT|nr:hypothetical protein RMSM_05295 [Rhodopirellula maiorica SM1]
MQKRRRWDSNPRIKDLQTNLWITVEREKPMFYEVLEVSERAKTYQI